MAAFEFPKLLRRDNNTAALTARFTEMEDATNAVRGIGGGVGCMNARRRKRRGVQPFYGTGWMGGNNKHNQHQQATYAYNQQYNGQQQGYAGYPQQGADGSYPAPPPAYGQAQQNPQYTGTTFNPNDGYYGGHNEGIQLQQPQSSYQRDVYSPPAGPPPGK
ncbi:hypothetical protein Ct61P_01128 [Colletotrichum tofieldiae]|nr:hypothetical protein Ct61P_01128 [Colletotrichum tofieldiae]